MVVPLLQQGKFVEKYYGDFFFYIAICSSPVTYQYLAGTNFHLSSSWVFFYARELLNADIITLVYGFISLRFSFSQKSIVLCGNVHLWKFCNKSDFPILITLGLTNSMWLIHAEWCDFSCSFAVLTIYILFQATLSAS